jgi:hypothetical protein
MTAPIRIAMWSGPRNISTAMMRAFENRGDTAVIDEPFYAHFLSITGRTDHPYRDEVLKALPTDWHDVVKGLLGPVPRGKPIFYQKQMLHHMVEPIGFDWIKHCRNAFLIRDPNDVVASYFEKIEGMMLSDIGIVRQAELFDRESQRLGKAPPVIDARDVLENPRGALIALCAALGITFSEKMLSWPPGSRASDGVWAPYWYANVERSTGFAPPAEKKHITLSGHLRKIADEARPYYERLARHKLSPS